jgi:hypothetical protein
LKIAGLPFTAANLTESAGEAAITIHAQTLASNVDGYVVGFVAEGATTITIREAGITAAGNDMGAHIDTGTVLRIGGTYIAA